MSNLAREQGKVSEDWRTSHHPAVPGKTYGCIFESGNDKIITDK